ncbi:MAG TPA: OstA-like protein [Bacteriovoracaceae bacterium]|nr:OstA-like protein [Bacteriovoracaceae bacterium]
MSLVLIIFWATLCTTFAADNPQLTLGDKISVYSDKAYRKNNGRYFEAVGNVVIISQKDTIYGELASLDQDSSLVKIEGNVRLITKDLTLYGSHLEYNIANGRATIKNARILTTNFNLVANRLSRVSETEYLAEEAEFTTCKDCAESWSVYGKTIKVKINEYVQIQHGLAKIKNVNVLYIPYIILPISTTRKTGLLIPKTIFRKEEGLSFQQPVFFALGDHKDMTLSPSFWGKRGYGADVQYRQRFSDMSWMEIDSRSINDQIYQPGKNNSSLSGKDLFRYFVEAEAHQFWTPNLGSHLRYTGTRDLDIVQDQWLFTDPKILSSDLGLNTNVHYRRELFSLTADAHYLRNQLSDEPLKFDRSYVQVLPRVTLSSVPYTFIQSKRPFFQSLSVGMDNSFTRFRQTKEEESLFLRNADRFSSQPYLMWHLLTLGPVSLKSRYTLDYQSYRFSDTDEKSFGKYAGLLRTELSFTMDKIFGLAYQEKIPLKNISEKDLRALRERKEQGLSPLRSTQKENRLVGDLPEFASELSRDTITQVRNSYRHSQEFKFIHHFISVENEYGNLRFLEQIKASQDGQFDYEDSVRSEEFLFGTSTTRTIVPPENTVEFQWNNSLIRKTPKQFNFLDDNKYLRDNFNYSKIGYFNVSQGYLLNNRETEDYNDRLTRFLMQTGYYSQRWSVGLEEYYFHSSNDNMLTLNFNRRFEYLNLFSAYTYNSFNAIQLLSFGGQVRPTDVLGVAMLKDMSFTDTENVRTTYSVDIMPHNNCWILNLNYQERINDTRYSFNVLFNFGDDNFQRYRNDYFAAKRL